MNSARVIVVTRNPKDAAVSHITIPSTCRTAFSIMVSWDHFLTKFGFLAKWNLVRSGSGTSPGGKSVRGLSRLALDQLRRIAQ